MMKSRSLRKGIHPSMKEKMNKDIEECVGFLEYDLLKQNSNEISGVF
jgi:hypothetical protein